ncbi:BZ3500_MvSof-1268-A1-R1_Chr6-2g08445 [Microbotryum saponariae]|uniref:BZ3500_MvSof-1268-A1-R1_Chr6-2g08445 protein n=1 Tax=Microbotryum saponariae TaxID=289078 RepID=A0A2X0MLH7_9BASI|nr:BZ3500_MvSof-1268-A1-R1_Chr6-2g08445 [Microbotryum saponariae]SDA07722.1 BZ3501_MvSof-1269-A2-R1_Chr6-1g08159 [Microbotryum saponariae]
MSEALANGLAAPYYPASHPSMFQPQRGYPGEPLRPTPQYAYGYGGTPITSGHPSPMVRSPSGSSSIASSSATSNAIRPILFNPEARFFLPGTAASTYGNLASPAESVQSSSYAPSMSPLASPFPSNAFNRPLSRNQGGDEGDGVYFGVQPSGLPRSRIGHANTPSFHPVSFQPRQQPPQHGKSYPKQGSTSLRPGGAGPQRAHGRAVSVSPSANSTASGSEKKKKAVHVRVPNENGLEEGSSSVGISKKANEGGNAAPQDKKKASIFVRRPIQGEEKRLMLVELGFDIDLLAEDVTSRHVHFDEVRINSLPPTIEIFLPGQDAWQDVREHIGIPVSPQSPSQGRSPLLSGRFGSFLDRIPSAFSPGGHQRSNSLFNNRPSFPPRFQNAIESLTRHASSQSVSRGFTIPHWAQSLAATAPKVLDQLERGMRPGITGEPQSPIDQNTKSFEASRPNDGDFARDIRAGSSGSGLTDTLGELETDRNPRQSSVSTLQAGVTPKLSTDTSIATPKSQGLVIFEAPPDVDRTPPSASPLAVPKGVHSLTPHKVTHNFSFPPRGIQGDKLAPAQPYNAVFASQDVPVATQESVPAKKSSLNIAAPEFVFGASAASALFASQARQPGLQLGEIFGEPGTPGSLAATDEYGVVQAQPPLSTLSAASLNPLAGTFQPTSSLGLSYIGQSHAFNFQPPAHAPQYTTLAQEPTSLPTRHTPADSADGPAIEVIQPTPLRPVSASMASVITHTKRQKLNNGSGETLQRTKSHLELRSPFSKNPTLAEVDREHDADAPLMSPSPTRNPASQYLLHISDSVDHLVKSESESTLPHSSTLRTAASFSAERPSAVVDVRASSAPLVLATHPSRRHEADTSGAPEFGVAIHVDAAVPFSALDPQAEHPWERGREQMIPHDQIGQAQEDAFSVVSEDSSLELESTLDDTDLESELGESPLQILENLLAGYFSALQSALAKKVAERAKSELEDRDGLLGDLIGRVVASIADARIVGADNIEKQLTKLHEALEDGQRLTRDSLGSAVQQWLEEGRGFDSRPSPAPLTPELVSSLRDDVVNAVAKLLNERSLTVDRTALPTGVTSREITKAVEMATQPLHKAFAASRRTDSIIETPLPGETAGFAQHISDKVESSTALLKNAVSLLDDLKNSTASSADVDSLFERIASLRSSSATVAAGGSFDVHSVSSQLVSDLQPRLDDLAQEVKLSTIASSFDIDVLIERIAAEIRSAQPRDVWSKSLEALVEAHQKLERDGSEIGANQQSLLLAFKSLEAYLSQQLQQLGDRVESQVKNVVLSTDAVANVADLELQLAKARSDYGKARSEKATMMERFELERGTWISRIDELKAEIDRRKDVDRVVDEEKAMLTAAIGRLEQALVSSTSHSAQLETALASLTLRQDSDRLDEVEHRQALSLMRDELDRTKAGAELSATEVRLLLAENSRLTAELGELREAHEKLSNQKHEDDQHRRVEREATAKLSGEVGALEKRIAVQDDKIVSLQLLKSKQQQALAQANQRAVDLRKRAAEVGTAEARIADLEAAKTSLEERLAASEAVRELLTRDSTEYRRTTENELEAVRETVTREFEGKDARIRTLEQERNELSQDNERLETLNLELSDALRMGSMRSSSSVSRSATPSRSAAQNFMSYAAGAQHYPSPDTLKPQRTGSSTATIRTATDRRTSNSPTPSTLEGRALVVDESGWWSAE